MNHLMGNQFSGDDRISALNAIRMASSAASAHPESYSLVGAEPGEDGSMRFTLSGRHANRHAPHRGFTSTDVVERTADGELRHVESTKFDADGQVVDTYSPFARQERGLR